MDLLWWMFTILDILAGGDVVIFGTQGDAKSREAEYQRNIRSLIARHLYSCGEIQSSSMGKASSILILDLSQFFATGN